MSLEYRLLGPLEVRVDGRVVPINSAKQRVLLAALLIDANRALSYDELVHRLWDADDTPSTPRNTLHSYVMRLRRAIGTDTVITTRPDGYLVEVPPDNLDTTRFESLVHAARAAGDPATAATLLRQALDLWRGDPLLDVPSEYLRRDVTALWQERRLAAIELRVDADLALGRHQDIVTELANLTAHHPVRERFWAQRMLALYRSGRAAEALHCHTLVRKHLADELGIDPGPELRDLHQAILTEDPALAAPVQPPTTRRRSDLPGDIPDFIGRTDELDRLVAMLPASGGPPVSRAVVISAIDGMAGVGKTALAVHAAHELADRYPDGQLFIDLRGHAAHADPIEPADALDTLLRALDVPADRIPAGLDERAAAWRAELANRKVLVLLDNAGSASQVRPLLPGSPTCLALITSRRRLADLDTTATLSLDVLSERDALALFTSVVGANRVRADVVSTSDVLRWCGHLPLAIRIAAARLRSRPAWPVAVLADRLRDEAGRDDQLHVGDRSVTAALTLSYDRLTGPQRRLFALLGSHPGTSFDIHQAAALGDISLAEAEPAVAELVDMHLVAEPAPGRYRFHDLVRRYAGTRTTVTEAERHDALRRLLEWYLWTAWRASERVYPAPTIEPPMRGTAAPLEFRDTNAAFDWLEAEHGTLIAAMDIAARTGWDEFVWRVAWTMWEFFDKRSLADHRVPVYTAGLAAARRQGTLVGAAHMLSGLGAAYIDRADYQRAHHYYSEQLATARQAGSPILEAGALTNLAIVLTATDDLEGAMAHQTRAAEIYDDIGHHTNNVAVLNNTAVVLNKMGRFDEALTVLDRALALADRWNITRGRSQVITSIGVCHAGLGDHRSALEYFERALAANREHGFRPLQGNNLQHMGDSHAALGDFDTARALWRQALQVYRDCDYLPNVDHVLARLAGSAQAYQWSPDLSTGG